MSHTANTCACQEARSSRQGSSCQRDQCSRLVGATSTRSASAQHSRGRSLVLDERLGASPPTRRCGGGDAGHRLDYCDVTDHLERQAGRDALKER
eukprot:8970933-Alexandrium_andersonii.AAC.1